MNKPHKGSQFLHNHPGIEKRLGLDEVHVIVDRADWEKAREIQTILHGEIPMPTKEELENFLTTGNFEFPRKLIIPELNKLKNDQI